MGLVGSFVLFFPIDGNGNGLLFRVNGLFQDAACSVWTDEACIPGFLAADNGQVSGDVTAITLLRVQFHFLRSLYKPYARTTCTIAMITCTMHNARLIFTFSLLSCCACARTKGKVAAGFPSVPVWSLAPVFQTFAKLLFSCRNLFNHRLVFVLEFQFFQQHIKFR